MTEFVITFRETLEAAIIVWIVATFLTKHKMWWMLKQVWWWIWAALVWSIVFAWGLWELQAIVGNTAYEKLFEAVMMFITAWILLYMVVRMTKGHYSMFQFGKTASQNPNCLWCDLNQETQQLKPKTKQTIKEVIISSTQSSIGQGAKYGVFWLIFFAILREGFETALFLYSSINLTWGFSHLGFWWGIIIASILGYLLFVAGKRISLQKFFTVSSVMLIIFAAWMATYGVHELEEFAVKQWYIQESSIVRVWDIYTPQETVTATQEKVWNYNESKEKRYHPLHDKWTYGIYLKSFLWYNSDPNPLEPIVWLTVLLLWWYLWKNAQFWEEGES